MKNLTLAGCAMDFANFDACRLERVCVSDSRLKGAVFSQCRVKDVYWDRVDLTGASFLRRPFGEWTLLPARSEAWYCPTAARSCAGLRWIFTRRRSCQNGWA